MVVIALSDGRSSSLPEVRTIRPLTRCPFHIRTKLNLEVYTFTSMSWALVLVNI